MYNVPRCVLAIGTQYFGRLRGRQKCEEVYDNEENVRALGGSCIPFAMGRKFSRSDFPESGCLDVIVCWSMRHFPWLYGYSIPAGIRSPASMVIPDEVRLSRMRRSESPDSDSDKRSRAASYDVSECAKLDDGRDGASSTDMECD